MSWGPNSTVRTCSSYFINGYNFHTQEYGTGKATMNSSVCVQSSNDGDIKDDFYDLLDEILEVEYLGAEL